MRRSELIGAIVGMGAMAALLLLINLLAYLVIIPIIIAAIGILITVVVFVHKKDRRGS